MHRRTANARTVTDPGQRYDALTASPGVTAALDYHINNEDGLISIQVAGSPAPDALISTANNILNDDEFDSELPQLVDLREWQQGNVAIEDYVDVRTYLLEKYCPQIAASIAVVVDDNLSRDTCADIYCISAASGKAEMFEDYEQAVKWLIRKEFAGRDDYRVAEHA